VDITKTVNITAQVQTPVIAPYKAPQAQDCSLADNYQWDSHIARAICMAESQGRPDAYNPLNSNGTNDAGLFQINSIHVISGLIGDQERFDPIKNVEAAYKIYKGSGFKAWSSYTSGAYAKYL